MAQIKKLSIKTVYGVIDVKKLLAAPGEKLDCMQVIGNVVSLKAGSSSYGEWTACEGMFEATNCETGEVSHASVLFLPDVALIPLRVALAQEGTRGVEFAIKIGVKYVNDAKPGGSVYEYTWEPLLPPDANDPITRIKAKLAALPAPEGFKALPDAINKPAAGATGKGGRGGK
jgi:hypothetical protein